MTKSPVSHSSRAPLIVIGVVFLFIGAIFLYIGGSTFLEGWRYQQQALRPQAVATGKTLRRATSTSDTVYEISYRFTLAEGRPYQQTESVPVHLWERVERDSPLRVEYLPGQPESARVVQDSSEQKPMIIGWLSIGGLLALVGLFLFKGALRRSVPADRASVPAAAVPPQMTEPAGQPSTTVVSHEQSFWPLARRSFGFWFGGIFLLGGLPFFVAGIFMFYDDWRFAQEARSTQGMVLTKEIRRSGEGRTRSSETKHYEATYRFTVQGETLEGRDELSPGEWERLIEREPAEVLYRPQRPSSSRLAGRHPWLLKTMFALLGSVFTAIGGTVFVRAVHHARLAWRLRQHGVSTQGTVTELQKRNLKINDVQQWRLHYEYRDFQGHRHAKTMDVPEEEAQRWKVGDIGRVLYDSAQPTEAVWICREDQA